MLHTGESPARGLGWEVECLCWGGGEGGHTGESPGRKLGGWGHASHR